MSVNENGMMQLYMNILYNATVFAIYFMFFLENITARNQNNGGWWNHYSWKTSGFKYAHILSFLIMGRNMQSLAAGIHPPFSQWTPVKPVMQEQLYWLTASVQLAPFKHGPLRHSSISAKYGRITGKRFQYHVSFDKYTSRWWIKWLCCYSFVISLAVEYAFELSVIR